MSRALWILVWMRYRATVRRMFVGSAKRRVMTIIGGVFIVLWLASLVLSSVVSRREQTVQLPTTGLVWIAAGMMLIPLLGATRKGSGAFSPAEVDQLFPAPFTRRELVLYKIVYLAGVGVLASLWMSLLLGRHGRAWPQAFVGILVVMEGAMLVGLLGEQLRTGGSRRLRAWAALIGVLLLLLVGAVVEAGLRWSPDWMGAAAKLHTTIGGRVLSAPGLVVAEIMRGDDLGIVACWTLGAFGVLAVLVMTTVALGAAPSEKLLAQAEQQERVRRQFMRSGVFVSDPTAAAKRRVGMLPRWGGIGPIAWRQLVTLRRSSSLRVLVPIVAVVVGLVALVPMGAELAPMAGVLGTMMLFTLPNLFRVDFRGDLEHMDVLKGLPVSAWRVAAGQLLAPTLVIGAIVGMIVVVAAARAGAPVDTCAALAVASAPAALLVVALENLVFLLAPIATQGQTPGSPQAIGRGMIMALARLGALLVVAVPAAPAAWATYALTGWIAAAVLVGAAVVALAAAAGVGMVAHAFAKFDVSRDLPG